MRFGLTPKAEEDLIDIQIEGINRFGIRQARQYRDELLDCFNLLASHAKMARLRSEFHPPLRAHVHRSHVVTYVEIEGGILILRIFHARQDWPNVI
jgi:toxin ParE1/3/4